MISSSNPPVGAIAFGKAGIGCKVIEIHPDGVTLQHPKTCKTKRIPYNAIVRWEPPTNTTPKPGDRVRLRNTHIQYFLMETYPVFQGKEDNQPLIEQWSKLKDTKGKIYRWKLSQLEVV
jgi:hypothetical protein